MLLTKKQLTLLVKEIKTIDSKVDLNLETDIDLKRLDEIQIILKKSYISLRKKELNLRVINGEKNESNT